MIAAYAVQDSMENCVFEETLRLGCWCLECLLIREARELGQIFQRKLKRTVTKVP